MKVILAEGSKISSQTENGKKKGGNEQKTMVRKLSSHSYNDKMI